MLWLTGRESIVEGAMRSIVATVESRAVLRQIVLWKRGVFDGELPFIADTL